MPTANSTGFMAGGPPFSFFNAGTASVVMTPASGTIGGQAGLTMAPNTGCDLTAPPSGTDWKASRCTTLGGVIVFGRLPENPLHR
jgi:hypothetical protein